jgi:spermidine/putrescine transport system substrate-binding protein
MSQRRPPLSPEAAAIVKAQLSRRSLLGGAGALGLMATLAACGTSGSSGSSGSSSSDSAPKPAADKSDTDKVVNWANWTLYLDYDDKTKKYPTLEAFQKATGIKATYDEAIEDNDTYYGKIQGQLKNGQDIGKDIVVFTDWMASRVIRQGYTQELDKAVIPNAKNLLPNLQNVDFDPGRTHSLTWQSGYAGLAYNKKVAPVRTLDDLWRPDLKGKVEVLSEMRDTIGLIMLTQGVDISGKFTSDQFGNAIDVLQKQLDAGQIRQVKGNSYKEDLISGDCQACIAWSGDITQINFENDDQWVFVLPDSGGTLWSDNMMIPIGSPHKKNAEILMNYYYDPKVAAEVAAYVNYICPVEGAQEEMKSIDASLVTNPYIFPTKADLAKAHVFRTLSATEETEYTTAFQKALGV